MYMVAVLQVWAEWIIKKCVIGSQLTSVDGGLIRIKKPHHVFMVGFSFIAWSMFLYFK